MFFLQYDRHPLASLSAERGLSEELLMRQLLSLVFVLLTLVGLPISAG